MPQRFTTLEASTMDFEVDHDEQELQTSRALVERIFMLRPSDHSF
jgi:hypothetical protein